MEFTDFQKIILNAATIIAWITGIGISVVAAIKGRKMQEEMGVSAKVYLFLVGITEIFYIIGALMILSAMGINVSQHLANLEFGKVFQIVKSLDMTTIKIIGILGWVGFVINRSISFLSPGYLIIYGGKRLHPFFWWSSRVEVSLEIVMTFLIFTSLKWG
ncbi:MAG TPA: hypothetical protein DCX32_02150 [Candidatus Moranbacteria bacterium]|nr:MAG: hypothetical protein UW87_C0007G0022 [Candidatus Moranbacteria bacterium GW2011_GWC2_45_10]KKT95500.1 MAG: hypothetical protein UW95_C0001G0064 [Parcubacteria group bacterium GW2011_GWC1_45_14]HAV11322.1 hypothetical protein [Candidatus Moranbacteria bacterium]